MGTTILLLDDDDEFRRPVVKALKDRGFDVVEARKIAEAEALLPDTPVALMIIDGLLPDGSGIKYIKKLRTRMENRPIFFVSAFWKDMDTFKQLTEQFDVARVLHKPIQYQGLVSDVVRVIGEPVADKPRTPSVPPPLPVVAAAEDDDILELDSDELIDDEDDGIDIDVDFAGPGGGNSGRASTGDPETDAVIDEARGDYSMHLREQLERLARLVAETKKSAQTQNLAEIRMIAHRLRGNSGWFESKQLVRVLTNLETQMADAIDRKLRVSQVPWAKIEFMLKIARDIASKP